jgi:hypothetical protein
VFKLTNTGRYYRTLAGAKSGERAYVRQHVPNAVWDGCSYTDTWRSNRWAVRGSVVLTTTVFNPNGGI